MLRKTVAVLCGSVLLCTTGCGGSVTASSATAVNTQTGAVTETVTVSATITFGGTKPHISTGGSGTDTGINLLQETPVALQVDYSSNPQVTLIGQTDTGYTSQFVVVLQPTTTSVQPQNPVNTMYAWTIPDSPEFEAWQQDLTDHGTAQVALNAVAMTNFSNSNSGRYTIISTVQTPGSSNTASTSSSFWATAPQGPCGDDPACPEWKTR